MTAPEQLPLPLPPEPVPAWLQALIERHLDLMEEAPPYEANEDAPASRP